MGTAAYLWVACCQRTGTQGARIYLEGLEGEKVDRLRKQDCFDHGTNVWDSESMLGGTRGLKVNLCLFPSTRLSAVVFNRAACFFFSFLHLERLDFQGFCFAMSSMAGALRATNACDIEYACYLATVSIACHLTA